MATTINADATTGGAIVTGDNSGVLQLQTDGVTALTIGTDQSATFAGSVSATGGFVGAGATIGTPVTTSGAASYSISIPATAKQITISFNAISLAANNVSFFVQFSSGGVVQTSGYAWSHNVNTNAASPSILKSNSSSAFLIDYTTITTSAQVSGSMVCTLQNSSTNSWVVFSNAADTNSTSFMAFTVGKVELSGTIDAIKIISSDETTLFDAGAFNVEYV